VEASLPPEKRIKTKSADVNVSELILKEKKTPEEKIKAIETEIKEREETNEQSKHYEPEINTKRVENKPKTFVSIEQPTAKVHNSEIQQSENEKRDGIHQQTSEPRLNAEKYKNSNDRNDPTSIGKLKLKLLNSTEAEESICNICKTVFKNKQLMSQHKIECQYFSCSYFCPACSDNFQNSFELKKHCIDMHKQERAFWCKVCSAKFTDRFNLVQVNKIA
jgi:hypothetical protein